MRELQLRSTEQSVLQLVHRTPGLDGQTIANMLGYSVAYVAQLLANLSELGFLKRSGRPAKRARYEAARG